MVHMNSGGIAHCHPDWSWDTRQRPFQDYDLWCVFAGQGQLRTPTQTFQIGSGDCFILPPNQGYVGRHNAQNPLHVIFIHFTPKTDIQQPILHRKLSNLSTLQHLLTRAVTLFQDGQINQANGWLQAALQEVQYQEIYQPSDKSASQIDALCDHIRAHPEHTYRVKELSAKLNLSTDHFTRLFKKSRGTTPRNFILNARIDTAQNLLQASNHSIARIADILGYSDVYYFSKQFKTRTGLTPTQFRKHRT